MVDFNEGFKVSKWPFSTEILQLERQRDIFCCKKIDKGLILDKIYLLLGMKFG